MKKLRHYPMYTGFSDIIILWLFVNTDGWWRNAFPMIRPRANPNWPRSAVCPAVQWFSTCITLNVLPDSQSIVDKNFLLMMITARGLMYLNRVIEILMSVQGRLSLCSNS